MSNNSLPQRRPRPARLVIADDHELARAGLRTMLAGLRGVEVIGEAKNGREALALCRRLQPDLALIDVRMPDMDGLATCRSIKQECPATDVILITMHENPQYLLAAFRAGASAYVLKDITQRKLLATTRRVLRGESALNPENAIGVLGHHETSQQGELPAVQLTPREHEVLQFLAQGQTNREIACKFTVSVSTIKTHVEHILAKLGVSDRTRAAVRASELGLLKSTGAK